MHYYQFNIKSYQAATLHLSNDEDLAYRRLMDFYYDTESAISAKPDKPTALRVLSRRLRVGMPELEIVLDEFFEFDGECWKNGYCDQVLADYRAFVQKQKDNGSKGGRGNKANANPNKPTALPEEPNAKPTINHKPITTNHIKPIGVAKATKAKRLDLEVLPVEWSQFCKSERPELNPQEVFAQFRDYWIAQGGQRGCKLDWQATWRNWVRNQKASIKTKQDQGNEAFHQLTGGMLRPKQNDAVFQSIAQTIDMESDHASLR
jgi:uncharacterized protein YdaU (DUF1376 family)